MWSFNTRVVGINFVFLEFCVPLFSKIPIWDCPCNMKLSIVPFMLALAANQLAPVIGEPCNVNYEKVAIDGYVIKAFGVCEYKEEVEWQVEINTR